MFPKGFNEWSNIFFLVFNSTSSELFFLWLWLFSTSL